MLGRCTCGDGSAPPLAEEAPAGRPSSPADDGDAVTKRKALLPALTGIRGIAATWVIIEHFWDDIRVFAPELRFLRKFIVSGFLSVEIFFVLSGFIIAYQYAEKFTSWSLTFYRNFLVNRLARLYPVHLVTLFAAATLVGGAHVLGIELTTPQERTPYTFVLNVLMLHGILYKQAFNGPAWSISVEFAAYIVFPLIAVILLWFRTPRSAYAAAGMVLVSGTAVLLAIGHWVNPSSTGQGMFWARIITEFLAGALLWKGWSMMKQPFGRWGDALVWSTVVATLVFLYFVDAQTTKVPEVFAATPLMALYVLGCAAAVGSAQRVLGSRQAVWAGRVSYSLYLTHFLVLVPVGKVIEPQDLRSAPLVLRCGWILLWLCLCYVAAYLTYTYLEEPARAWMRRRFLKEAPPVEAPDAATGDIPGP